MINGNNDDANNLASLIFKEEKEISDLLDGIAHHSATFDGNLANLDISKLLASIYG